MSPAPWRRIGGDADVCEMVLKAAAAFDVLCLGKEITSQSSETELRQAYLRLARLVHPDKSQSPLASDAFQRLTWAYKTLTNPKALSDADGWQADSQYEKVKAYKGEWYQDGDGTWYTDWDYRDTTGKWHRRTKDEVVVLQKVKKYGVQALKTPEEVRQYAAIYEAQLTMSQRPVGPLKPPCKSPSTACLATTPLPFTYAGVSLPTEREHMASFASCSPPRSPTCHPSPSEAPAAATMGCQRPASPSPSEQQPVQPSPSQVEHPCIRHSEASRPPRTTCQQPSLPGREWCHDGDGIHYTAVDKRRASWGGHVQAQAPKPISIRQQLVAASISMPVEAREAQAPKPISIRQQLAATSISMPVEAREEASAAPPCCAPSSPDTIASSCYTPRLARPLFQGPALYSACRSLSIESAANMVVASPPEDDIPLQQARHGAAPLPPSLAKPMFIAGSMEDEAQQWLLLFATDRHVAAAA